MISKNYKFEKKWRKRKVKEYSKGIYVKFKPEEVEILHNRMNTILFERDRSSIKQFTKIYMEDCFVSKKYLSKYLFLVPKEF